MRAVVHVVLVLSVLSHVYGARILGVFNVPSVSHQVVYQPIWKELSLRGHEVTVITPNPLKDPTLTNLTEIDVSFMYDELREMYHAFSETQNHWGFMKIMFIFAESLAEQLLSDKNVESLINDTSKEFDVVLAEHLQTFTSAFAERYKCPLIAVASLELLGTTNWAIGNPVHPILNPDFTSAAGRESSFFERVETIIYTIWQHGYHHFISLPRVDRIVKKYFGKDMPYIGELERNVSLVLQNTNPIIHTGRAYLPSVIQLGRMHLKPKRRLPNDLQNFLDDAKEGVIYFSLGSNVKSIHIDQEKRKLIMETFAELPYKILWKFEADHMEGKPKNVKISKWLPQQDLLGHPNIKLFITQAGLQSTEEAIMNRVPLLGLPFFADQQFVANRYVALGIGLTLDFQSLTKKQLKNAILEILQNPRYKEKVNEVGSALIDEPNTGLERAVWWTEYVIRHKGAPYFRSPALDMPLYQYYLLDVISLFIVTLLCILYTTSRLFKYITKYYRIRAATKKQKTL